ncbi:tetratricopeptide repeat protein 38-like [Anneissia japonica]|uniref:tetratricopeptide repeat protein 38-like n=1 Tax=Anneissia japonica TaxID=1529436 RepID=UPI00142583C1|nr:tetratricopeptide repeat protein 38-like [Anneissia japonica]
MAKHCHWRDCLAWKDEGLEFSTTSNEACKLYDAALTQIVGWYHDKSLGGWDKTFTRLREADPDFVMGHVLTNGLTLCSTSVNIQTDEHLKKRIDDMVSLKANSALTNREEKHVEALQVYADGSMSKAIDIWEDILVDHPTDLLALKFCQLNYYNLGQSIPMRDSVARVFPHWKSSTPLYGYLYGMHAFGLEESGMYVEGEKAAAKGLAINPNDCWSTHANAHCLEMTGRHDQGIKFMTTTENDWKICDILADHIYWHFGLYYIEIGEYSKALDIYDSEILPRCVASNYTIHAASFLYRLEFEGVKVGKERWQVLYETGEPAHFNHLLVYKDLHYVMASLRADHKDTAKTQIESIRQFIRERCGDQRDVMKEVGLPVCEALVAYENGDYAEAVDLLNPVRYKFVNMGGSNAQRDEFQQLLIHAAINSPKKHHKRLARSLLSERKALRENSPLTDRLQKQLLAMHIDE